MPKRFYEKQYFAEQPFAWMAWGIEAVVLFYLFRYDLIDNATFVLVVVVSLLLMIGLMASAMTTEISTEAIRVRVRPFHLKFREYPWSDIESFEIRKYSPLGEYGGWGIRFGRHGKAYNVSGNMGLQLVFHDGSRLLIGTRKPNEMRDVLEAVRKS